MTDELALTERDIEVQFACIPECTIPIFYRSDPEWEEHSAVWIVSQDEGGWRPRWLGQRVIVSMFDACPHPFLRPHEYRVWNEYVIKRLVRGLRGSGVLTIVHRIGWPWHFGLAWSRYPLLPDHMTITERPPVWWGAMDLWGELEGGFPDLYQRVHAELYRNNVEWERQVARRRRLVEDGLIEPQRRMPDAEMARFRQRIEQVLTEGMEERRDARLLPERR